MKRLARLLPAALLAALPALARADTNLAEVLVPIAVVGTIFGMSAVVVGIVAYAAHRNRRLRHETIRLAIEKGHPLPPELLDPPPRRDPLARDLRAGLVLLAIGLGVALYLGTAHTGEAQRQWPVGFIPALMGAAYLVAYAVARRHQAGKPPQG